MSATTSTPSKPTCGSSAQYEIPVKDASCAVPNTDNYPKLLESCCQGAPVSKYDNDCAIYCLAAGQSVQDLTDCLYDAKVDWGDVWCFGDTNATATASVSLVKATATATSTASGKGKSASSTKSGAAEATGSNGAVSMGVGRMAMGAVFAGLVMSLVVGL
ncbi:hypothetical protein BDV25DRAFT_168293 [Aspergillus avenaceus]|uniref:Uncharacterized protein n=1 Tax=Aspergillus avenaceus TaxID=36643 RepID=A0A5N6U548_ASPAV|nr:hypothetical protein BDV25DRAFT_168293 [Aspergillus avenaceus]